MGSKEKTALTRDDLRVGVGFLRACGFGMVAITDEIGAILDTSDDHRTLVGAIRLAGRIQIVCDVVDDALVNGNKIDGAFARVALRKAHAAKSMAYNHHLAQPESSVELLLDAAWSLSLAIQCGIKEVG